MYLIANLISKENIVNIIGVNIVLEIVNRQLRKLYFKYGIIFHLPS